jgi:Holliday junction resolvase RusA-like endonuclease
MQKFDADAWTKSGLDAMKHAKLIVDDSSEFVEIGSLTFSRDWEKWGTKITLEDLEG